MCGICGSVGPFARHQKLIMMLGNERRGEFSCGGWSPKITWRIPDSISAAVIDRKIPDDAFDGPFLFHARRPSSGRCRDKTEATTHPFTFGSWTVAHNGFVRNADELLAESKVADKPKELLVDSQIIPIVLEEHGIEGLSKVGGSAGLWAVNSKEPDRFYLWCCNQDLHYTKGSSGLFAFSSERMPILCAEMFHKDGVVKMASDNLMVISLEDGHTIEDKELKGAPLPQITYCGTHGELFPFDNGYGYYDEEKRQWISYGTGRSRYGGGGVTSQHRFYGANSLTDDWITITESERKKIQTGAIKNEVELWRRRAHSVGNDVVYFGWTCKHGTAGKRTFKKGNVEIEASPKYDNWTVYWVDGEDKVDVTKDIVDGPVDTDDLGKFSGSSGAGGSTQQSGTVRHLMMNGGVSVKLHCNDKLGLEAVVNEIFVVFDQNTRCEVKVTNYELACISKLNIRSATELNKFRVACHMLSRLQAMQTCGEDKLLAALEAKLLHEEGGAVEVFQCDSCKTITSIGGVFECEVCGSKMEKKQAILLLSDVRARMLALQDHIKKIKEAIKDTRFSNWHSERTCDTCGGSGIMLSGMACVMCYGGGKIAVEGKDI